MRIQWYWIGCLFILYNPDMRRHFNKRNVLVFIIGALTCLFGLFVYFFLRVQIATPKNGFVYTTCEAERCIDNYYVLSLNSQGRIIEYDVNPGGVPIYLPKPKLKYYSFKDKTVKDINIGSDSRYWILDPSRQSPDGYTFSYHMNIWGGYSDTGCYLKKGMFEKRIDTKSYNPCFSMNGFLGWVTD